MSGQQAQLPEWIIWLQALAVPLLGMFAAWIAYQQWRTAARKVQLDLYDRRFTVYDQVRDALFPIIATGRATIDDIGNYGNAVSNARFMFGDDIVKRFEEIENTLIYMTNCCDEISSGTKPRKESMEGSRNSFIEISKFFNNLPIILSPYMRLDHKIGGAFEWVGVLRIRRIAFMERVLKYSKGRIRALKALRAPRKPKD